jgi:hypothetical protein
VENSREHEEVRDLKGERPAAHRRAPFTARAGRTVPDPDGHDRPVSAARASPIALMRIEA